MAGELPRPKPRREPIDVQLELLFVEAGGRVLFERRADAGRMAGMWQLPTRERPGAEEGGSGLFPPDFRGGGALRLGSSEPLLEIRHSITHHRIRARVHRGRVEGAVSLPYQWFAAADAPEQALTGMTKKVLKRMMAARSADQLFE